jgi:hypothetical protein
MAEAKFYCLKQIIFEYKMYIQQCMHDLGITSWKGVR